MPRPAVVSLALSAALFLILSAPSRAEWGPTPTCVLSTNELVAKVTAASDGAAGAIVAFETTDTLNGAVHPLRALHLLADGTRDPGWPAAGTTLSTFTGVQRGDVGAIGDTTGGAFVWWLEGTSLYVTRVAANGTVPTSWPARGRLLGTVPVANQRPQAFTDGAGGVYIGWLGKPNALDPACGRIIRLGPANTGNAGWPNATRSFAIPDAAAGQSVLQFAFCPAASGGVWVAWGDQVWDGTQYQPGRWRVSRQTTTGFDPNWTDSGREVGVFQSHLLTRPMAPTHRLVALADAGDGGVYVLSNEEGASPYGGGDGARVRKFSADGSVPQPWSAAGFAVGCTGYGLPEGGNWENSLDLLPAAGGGAFAFTPAFFSDGGPEVWVSRVEPTATFDVWDGITNTGGHEELSCPGGSLYLSSFNPIGPYGWYTPDAYLWVSQFRPNGQWAGGAGEWHPEILMGWYGDIALVPTSGDGAIFLWSQMHDLHGIYARRFTTYGEYAGVPDAGHMPATLRVHFDRDRGILVNRPEFLARATLHDLSGRTVIQADSPPAGGEWVIPQSRSLSPGVYFVRATLRDGTGATAKVVVWR